MAGEQYILEVEFANVAGVNFQNNQIAVLDVTNSTSTESAAKTVDAVNGGTILGVIKDVAHVDAISGAVTSTGMNVRTHGISRVIANGAISAGAYVGTGAHANTGAQGQALPISGQAGPQTLATAFPLHSVLGVALTPAAAAGDQPLVLLTPGGLA